MELPHQGLAPIHTSAKSLRPVFFGVLAAKAAVALFLVLQLVLLPHAVNGGEALAPTGPETVVPAS